MKGTSGGVCSIFEGAIKEKWVTNPTYFLQTMAYLSDNRLYLYFNNHSSYQRVQSLKKVLELDRLALKLGFLT